MTLQPTWTATTRNWRRRQLRGQASGRKVGASRRLEGKRTQAAPGVQAKASFS